MAVDFWKAKSIKEGKWVYGFRTYVKGENGGELLIKSPTRATLDDTITKTDGKYSVDVVEVDSNSFRESSGFPYTNSDGERCEICRGDYIIIKKSAWEYEKILGANNNDGFELDVPRLVWSLRHHNDNPYYGELERDLLCIEDDNGVPQRLESIAYMFDYPSAYSYTVIGEEEDLDSSVGAEYEWFCEWLKNKRASERNKHSSEN